jgi:hypothetical protein
MTGCSEDGTKAHRGMEQATVPDAPGAVQARRGRHGFESSLRRLPPFAHHHPEEDAT